MKISEVMHAGVIEVGPATGLREAARLMQGYDVGALPVVENGRLVGIITDRDIVLRALTNGRDPGGLAVCDVMTEGVVCCRSDDTVEDVILLMAAKKIRRLPVVDEALRVIGMVTLGDVSHRAGRALAGELAQAVTAHHR